ncbi:N/A [soil metagenome]
MSRRDSRRSAPFSSQSRQVPPSATGRKVGRRPRARRAEWSGSSKWSPYNRQDRLWPKFLLIGVVLVIIIGGSVFVASALSDRNNDDDGDSADVPAVAVGTATEPSEASGADDPTEADTEAGDGLPTAPLPPGVATATPQPTPSPTPLPPGLLTAPKRVAEIYVDAWSAGAYAQMYEIITASAKEQITKDDFIARYEAIAVEAGIISVDASVVGGQEDDRIFSIKAEFDSSRIGVFTDENQVPISRDGDEFRVDWSPSLIFAGLGDGYVEWSGNAPERGRILDRKGRPLAETGFISRVGIIPGQITNEADMLSQLSQLLEMEQDTIRGRYESGQPNWFMPVKDYPDDMDQNLIDALGEIDGVVVQNWPARVYPLGSAAAHVTGYLSEITAEELPELSKRGYEAGDLIGRGGVEAFAEEWLAGKRGGTLSLRQRDGTLIRVIGEVQSEPAKDVVLTIDSDLQIATDASIGDEVGSAVVMDPWTGQVLAMASRPTFDPNQFILGLSSEQWAVLNEPDTRPLVNRATTEVYPTGSTFKVVTAAAAIAHLGYVAGSPINCPGTFSLEGADQVWHDWIPGGQGQMDLHTGIYRSCNTVFYQLGEALDRENEMYLPDMARAFGFGQPTGIDALYEVPGTVPDPEWKQEVLGDAWARGDAVNFAIGQGFFAATTLQLTNAYAALTNGGTLYEPYLIMDVVTQQGDIIYKGEPTELGKIPLSPEQIKIITDAMYDVIHASNGTAVSAFAGAPYSVSGKTGTAETGREGEADHGSFGSFAPSSNPRVTIAALIENGVAGSQSAAPVARRIYDVYFELYPG